MVNFDNYPNLKPVAWHLRDGVELTDEEAFQLIERNWRHIDLSELTSDELALIDRLTATCGNGVRLV